MVDKTTSSPRQVGQLSEIQIVDPSSNNLAEDSCQIKVEAVREGMVEEVQEGSNKCLVFNIYKIRM